MSLVFTPYFLLHHNIYIQFKNFLTKRCRMTPLGFTCLCPCMYSFNFVMEDYDLISESLLLLWCFHATLL
uniref:Putative ovule protein n=1 Tax=Solanum chacoense TaxID=4108 RepID=A0A0V0HD04_SOLCH